MVPLGLKRASAHQEALQRVIRAVSSGCSPRLSGVGNSSATLGLVNADRTTSNLGRLTSEEASAVRAGVPRRGRYSSNLGRWRRIQTLEFEPCKSKELPALHVFLPWFKGETACSDEGILRHWGYL